MNRWIVLSFSLPLFLSGCGKKKDDYRPSSQELRLNLHSEPPTLDPRKAVDITSIPVIKMCFEGLMRIGRDGQPEFAAAERVEISPDQKQYTFYLRNAHWSDGKKVSAYDFEKSWKTMLGANFLCEFAIDLYLLKNGKATKEGLCPIDEVGVHALDERTLHIELEHPVPYFMSALATHSFYPTPIHVIENSSDWVNENYVGNGPFQLTKWRHHHSIVVEKNPYYWDKEKVKLEKIQLVLIEDLSTELSMYENNELDWAGHPLSALPEDALPTLALREEFEKFPISGTYFYVFNTKAFPFNNVNMRKAFTLAIDRQAIIDHVTLSKQLPATALVPPTMWNNDLPFFKDHDVDEARRLFQLALKELNIKKEELPPITLSYNTLSAHHKIAQAVQQQWNEAFGIRVHLENKEWKVFLDELRQHQFQIARLGAVASINDPSTFLDYYRYLSSSNNHSQWTSPPFSELLEEADLTADAEKRILLLRKAEKILMDEMPIAPLYFYMGSYLKKPYVKQVYLSELLDVDFKWAYLETKE